MKFPIRGPMLLASAVLLLAGVACASEDSPDTRESGPPSPTPAPTIEVIARDYDFELSETPAAGEITFTLRNEGKEKHELIVFKLKTDRSAKKVLELPQNQGRRLVEEVGGTFARPGRSADKPIRAELTPGVYALVCFVPSPDGTPHFAKGMVEEISVE